MAGNSKLRSLYLLNRLCFFDNFFPLEFVLMCSFKITDYFCHNEKNNFGITLVMSFSRQKPLKLKKKNHTIVWNSNVCRLAKFELPRLRDSKVIPRVPLQASCCRGVKSPKHQFFFRSLHIRTVSLFE